MSRKVDLIKDLHTPLPAGARRNGTPPDGASLLPHDMAVKVAKVFVPTLGSEKRLFAVGAQSEFFTATERTFSYFLHPGRDRYALKLFAVFERSISYVRQSVRQRYVFKIGASLKRTSLNTGNARRE